MLQNYHILAIDLASYASTIVKGVGFGVTLSFVAGPAMFALIQSSLTNGFKAGVHLAFGISLSDVFMVFLTLLGFSSLMDNSQSKMILSIVGGVVMVFFGTSTTLRPLGPMVILTVFASLSMPRQSASRASIP